MSAQCKKVIILNRNGETPSLGLSRIQSHNVPVRCKMCLVWYNTGMCTKNDKLW
jgi:hypothetical protein